MTDEPFDTRNDKGIVSSCMTFYAALYPTLRQAARDHGYALALHGSLSNDLDVVAIPWTEEASPQDTLLDAIIAAAGGTLLGNHGDKPHGRTAYTIDLGAPGGYIDLSVMRHHERTR